MIRRGTAADVDAVLRLWKEAGSPPSVTDHEAGVRGLLERDPEALLVAEDDGEVVGTLIVAFDGWRSYLYRTAVAATHRRRGVGRALVAAAEERARRLGGPRMDALVLDDDPEAQAFWRCLGFVPDERLTRWGKRL